MPPKAAHSSSSDLVIFIRNTFGSLFLIGVCPPLAFILCVIVLQYDGIIGRYLLSPTTIIENNINNLFGNSISWKISISFILLEIILMLILPGKEILGPQTPKNNFPKHKLNGFLSFIITIIIYEIGCSNLFFSSFFDGGVLFYNIIPLLSVFTIISIIICFFLYFKGILFPSSSDSGSSGNIIFDFYWGTELYPVIGKLDIKTLLHSRIGMTLWALLNISYLHAQFEQFHVITDAMLINVVMQIIYIGKHHWWEEGYMSTTDIIHDYEGYYLVYGCITFMPFTFTLSGMYLVQHPEISLGLYYSFIISILCLFFIYLNYSVDDQKQRFRETNGDCLIWGKKPKFIKVNVPTKKGYSLLLLSGWWGVCRHFHYFADLGGVFFWTLPAGFPWFNPVVYFYFIFLAILFIDRANRDDIRCRIKYGKQWDNYCSFVKYKICPFVW